MSLAVVAVLLAGCAVVVASAAGGSYVTSVTQSVDGNGQQNQATLKIAGDPNAGASGGSYSLCVRRTAPSATSSQCKSSNMKLVSSGCPAGMSSCYLSSVAWGTNFTFKGAGTYEATWNRSGSALGTTQNWDWGLICAPDGQLMSGVWQPSRLIVRVRCATLIGTIDPNYPPKKRGDGDLTFHLINQNSSTPISFTIRDAVEYMSGDRGRLWGTTSTPNPRAGQTYRWTGVYVCDTGHGHTEMHPIFRAERLDSSGNVIATFNSGPPYSTVWGGPYPSLGTHACS